MQYVSTRGDAPTLDFTGVLLTGLAIDGGLYVPTEYPSFDDGAVERFAELPYAAVATEVIWPFVEGSSISKDDLDGMVRAAYATFRHEDVVPTKRLSDDEYLLELFWGPTLSFKDVALQLLGRLFEHVLTAAGDHVTIVGATSGDTGSAAIEACRARDGIELVMLHPQGRVSDVQRRQMTTVTSANIHNVAVDGTFDDCQDLVKAMFGDRSFRDEMHLAAVNSINWARVAAQVVYYVTSSTRLAATTGRRPSYTVPTGNFGNILAADIARRMGAPIDQLVIASNDNDILTRTHDSGAMTIDRVVATTSPAMDIQVSSNFERVLHELFDRDGLELGEAMREFRSTGSLELTARQADALQSRFGAGAASVDEVTAAMRALHEEFGEVVDPHTGVAVHVGRSVEVDGPMVYVASAHPAKFGDAVVDALDLEPSLPEHLSDLLEREERCETVAPELAAMQQHVRAVTSAG